MMKDSNQRLDFEVVAEGLLFPEGPVALDDGSVVLVDMLARTLVRVRPSQSKQVIANLAGGPNGAALGPDGKIYVCNNGGFSWSRDPNGKIVIDSEPPADYRGGWIERVDIETGRVERLYESIAGYRLSAPNDLVFDRSGGLWFTDTGKTRGRTRSLGGVYYAAPGGKELRQAVFHGISFNGIGLSPDERTLYVADTFSATLWAYELSEPGVLDASKPPRVVSRVSRAVAFDSLAVMEGGDICVGLLYEGGIAQISPSGEVTVYAFPDLYVTNICFGGADRRDAYITLSETGRLIRARWPAPGLALNFGR